ncbi:MAG: hypothetical protein ACRETY_14320, partial [Steroidobacteraceae bacterium]
MSRDLKNSFEKEFLYYRRFCDRLGKDVQRHCHVGQLWLERTRQAKLAACRPSPPPTPATVS